MAADDGAKKPGPFDVRTIRELVGLMGRHDLSEIDLQEGDQRIRLRRGPRGVAAVSAPAAPPPAAAPAPAAAAPPTGNAEPAKPAKNLLLIKSPTPGTFYAASGPD